MYPILFHRVVFAFFGRFAFRMNPLTRSQSALTGTPRVGKRRGRLAALKDGMTEKASASPMSNARESGGDLDPSEHITFDDDPQLPEVAEDAKKELQVNEPRSHRARGASKTS